VSKNTVKRVLKRATDEVPEISREQELDEHLDTVKSLCLECKGNLVRVHEKLADKGVITAYSTLTRFCRANGLGARKKTRAGKYTFEPGEEMQHDTSPHTVLVGGVHRKVQCASVVFCFSTMIYAQVYLSFDRFHAKIFLTDAARFFGCVCGKCMVDNTSVIVAYGTGKNAVMGPEMDAFSARLGFAFKAHELGDANRSAHVERFFWYIETNFYPGRTFESLADLNAQLAVWCRKQSLRFKRSLGASPIELFQGEQPHLIPLPIYVPEVYALHSRIIDSEGYVTVHTNRYSAPEEHLGQEVEAHEGHDTIRVFRRHALLATHQKVEAGKGRRITLPEHRYEARWRRRKEARPVLPEEQTLKAAHQSFEAMIALLKKTSRGQAHRSVKQLYRMYMDYPTKSLVSAVTVAVEYGLTDLNRLERMVLRAVGGDFFRLTVAEPPFNDEEDDNG